ncbi:hypothetical protein ACVBIL_07420 [Shewanella sp. 125m-7]
MRYCVTVLKSLTLILAEGTANNIQFAGVADALTEPDTQMRLFTKPEIDGKRHLGGGLAKDTETSKTVEKP